MCCCARGECSDSECFDTFTENDTVHVCKRCRPRRLRRPDQPQPRATSANILLPPSKDRSRVPKEKEGPIQSARTGSKQRTQTPSTRQTNGPSDESIADTHHSSDSPRGS